MKEKTLVNHKILQANVTHARKLNRLFMQSIVDDFGYFSESFQDRLKQQHTTWRFTRAILTTASQFYIATDLQNRPIGYNLIRLSHNEDAFLHWMYLIPEYRKQGIGVGMVSLALKDLKNKGVQGIKLVTYNQSEFYSKLGFQKIGQSLIPIGGVDMQLMELKMS